MERGAGPECVKLGNVDFSDTVENCVQDIHVSEIKHENNENLTQVLFIISLEYILLQYIVLECF